MCRSPAVQLEVTLNGSFSIGRTHTTDPKLTDDDDHRVDVWHLTNPDIILLAISIE